jgi:hypothetical protein
VIKEWRSDAVKCLEDNALHYVCGYLMKKVRAWHNCTVCENMFCISDGYAKRNEVFTELKKFNNESKLVNVTQAFRCYVSRCEKKFMEEFDACMHERNIGCTLVAHLSSINVPTKCLSFPKDKFLAFFVRLRIYYVLKFLNASVKSSSNSSKILKQFQHK